MIVNVETCLLSRISIACLTGKFGRNCSEDCQCGNHKCDPKTGKCLCPTSTTGVGCTKGKQTLGNKNVYF